MSVYDFPDQTIPESEKTLDWHKRHIIDYVGYSATDSYTAKRKELIKLYYGYSAALDKEDSHMVTKTITQRCGVDFGPQYSVYPLIESKIDKLVGDYRKRPLKRKLLVTNPDAVNKKLDDKLNMIAESILRKENETLTDSIGFAPETPNPDIEVPKDIEEFFSQDYRTLSEENGEQILKQILIVRKEKEKYYEALKHYLITGSVWGFLDEKDGHPTIVIPNLLDIFHDYDPNETIQKDSQYFIWDRPMALNDIYNTFNPTRKQKEKIKNLQSAGTKNWVEKGEDSILRPRVISMIWKSRKTIRYKSYNNPVSKKEEYKILDADYKEENRDKIITHEIEDIRHITMIGPEVVLAWGSAEDQMKTKANPNKRICPVVGLVDHSTLGTGEIRSLAKKLLYLQGFASEILYELRLNMRQVDGNALVYDLANAPKQWLEGGPDAAMEKINFFLKRDRIQIINSRDKRANPYASSVNISQKGRIQDLMNMLGLIEDLADKMCGVKSGEQNPYQKAAVAEISFDNFSSRTEMYFGPFDTFTDIMNERLVLKAQHVYKKGDVFSFFAGDNMQKFLTISADFLMDDLGIYVTDNRKDYEDKQLINDVASKLFGNASSPEMMRDLIRIIKTDNVSEAESIMDKGVIALQKTKEENDKMMQQIEQEKIAWEKEKEDRADSRQEKQIQGQLDVATIYADNKAGTDNEKNNAENLRKLAEIESKLTIEELKAQNDKKEN